MCGKKREAKLRIHSVAKREILLSLKLKVSIVVFIFSTFYGKVGVFCGTEHGSANQKTKCLINFYKQLQEENCQFQRCGTNNFGDFDSMCYNKVLLKEFQKLNLLLLKEMKE